MSRRRNRWRVSAAMTNPRDFHTEHAMDAAREYVEEQQLPRFTTLLVCSVGRKPPERRRFKVTDDSGTLEPLPPFASNRELR